MFECNEKLNKFIFTLNNLNNIIEKKVNLNLSNDAIYSENFFRDLLNKLYSWNLRNANVGTSNFEAIDLIDETNKILVQVSASCTNQKIRDTLSKSKLTEYPDYTLYFLFIGNQNRNVKQGRYSKPEQIKFDARDNIILSDDLISKFVDETAKQDDILSIIENLHNKLLSYNPQQKNEETKKLHPASSIFFGDRFESSFPDVYEKYQIFSDEKIIHNRLSEFFKDCNYSWCSPIRKVRGSSLYDISSMEFEGSRILLKTILGQVFELKTERLVVFNLPGYWQKFMIVETKAELPIKIVGDINDTIVNPLKQEYTYSEGLGYSYKSGENRRYTVDGLLQSIEGDIETRIRYLVNYNFLIVPRYHPLAITATCYHSIEGILDNLIETENENTKDSIYEKIYQRVYSQHRTTQDNMEDGYVDSYC